MQTVRTLGTILLVAATLGLVGYLTWVTEPVRAPGVPTATATRSGGFGPVTPTPSGMAIQSCDGFDSWVWAQTALESNAALQPALDADGNGLACEELPVSGFAPVLWADSIPEQAEPATVVRVADGDTFTVTIGGETDTIRMKAIDAPEVSHTGAFADSGQCGGAEATDFLRSMLAAAPGGTVYLQYDGDLRDRFGRRLAYVWIEIEGNVYLVNEALARNGWAIATTYRSDRLYREQMAAAKQFSIDHVMGVPLRCGQFGQPVDATPNPETVERARGVQPDQGQFDEVIPGN